MNLASLPYKVLCVGDLCADVFASAVERLPQPGELALTNSIAVFPGGNALNTAVALRRLGEDVAISGSVGGDALGELLLASVRELGLDASGVYRETDGSTASTIVLRVEGEDRRFLHSLGVAADYTGDRFSEDLIPDRGIVMVGGYLKLGAWDDGLLAAYLKKAKERECRVVFNVCPAQDGGVDPKRCLRLAPYMDYFVLNEDEARVITDETTLKYQAMAMRESGARVAVITRGGDGLYAADGETVVEREAYRVESVDPSGCGDCFNAGLVAALLRGWDLPRALQFGSAVGALGATALGCTNGVPAFAEVERFIREREKRNG